jgi:hypothetical protein
MPLLLGVIIAIETTKCPLSMENMVFSHVEVKTSEEETKKRMLMSPFGTLLQKSPICRACKISTASNTGLPP